MKVSSVEIIIRKRDHYRNIVSDLQRVNSIASGTSLSTQRGSLTLYQTTRASVVREALKKVVEKELEEAKSELMLLGVTEFDE